MSATTTSGDRTIRRPVPRDMARILGDCRDLAIHRLLLSFTSMLDRVGDLLMARAERSDVREDQSVFLDAREVLTRERSNLMADFERHLRNLVDERISGKTLVKADFSAVDARKLTLVRRLCRGRSWSRLSRSRNCSWCMGNRAVVDNGRWV